MKKVLFSIVYLAFLSTIITSSAQCFADCKALYLELIGPLHHDFNREEGYSYLGANLDDGGKGAFLRIWLPNAISVEVISDVNGWKDGDFKLEKEQATGIWAGYIPTMINGSQYKFKILDVKGEVQYRNDPFGRAAKRGDNGEWNSVVIDEKAFSWTDTKFSPSEKPVIMEVHPGTIIPGKPEANFNEIADHLLPILKEHGITHVSFMPINQHNVVESWGYQPGMFFAVNPRHGTPNDFKAAVNKFHENGISVIIDLVHSHASKDRDTGLSGMDGTELYFHEGVMGHHPDWDTKIFNYGRFEAKDFLLSNAAFWLKEYHIDGFRFDGVASMIYLDYSRKNGEWVPASDGSNKNYAALEYLKQFNRLTHEIKPNVLTIAEESTGFPGITTPVAEGGYGFDYVWNMGGMHHIREFLKTAPQDRDLHYLTAPMTWGSNFINYANSHDETSHGKRYFIDYINSQEGEQRYAAFRSVQALLYLIFRGRPMVFQGDEFAVRGWWDEKTPVQREQLGEVIHQQQSEYMKALGKFYREEPAFSRDNHDSYRELSLDNEKKISVAARYGEREQDHLVVIQNWSDKCYQNYRVPVVSEGKWQIVFDSDAGYFGGTGMPISTGDMEKVSVYDTPQSVILNNLPPNTTIVLKRTGH